MSEILKSKSFVLGLVIISFIVSFFSYFVVLPGINFEWYSTKLQIIVAITANFTIVLALVAQFKRGMGYINRRSRGWIFKAYMLVTALLMIVFYFYDARQGPYNWVTLAIIAPLSSVNYGILTFYMASTAARAFRARNIKSMFLLLVGFIVLLQQAPLTGVYTNIFDPFAAFFNESFVTSVSRMFTISMTVGALIFGVRVLLGMENTSLGIGKEG